MDSLSDVVNRIRFKGTIYCVSEFTAPWGIRLPGHPGHLAFLMMLRGGCLATVEGSPKPFSLAGGELMLLPHGAGCIIQDRSDSHVTPIEQIIVDPPGKAE